MFVFRYGLAVSCCIASQSIFGNQQIPENLRPIFLGYVISFNYYSLIFTQTQVIQDKFHFMQNIGKIFSPD